MIRLFDFRNFMVMIVCTVDLPEWCKSSYLGSHSCTYFITEISKCVIEKIYQKYTMTAASKHFHSWFLVRIFLFWRTPSQTAPFELKLGDHQLERYLKKTEGGENSNIAYLYIIHADIGGIVDFQHGSGELTLLLK